jgi:hypothetical protein
MTATTPHFTFDAEDFMSSWNSDCRVYPQPKTAAGNDNFLSRKYHSAPVVRGDSKVMVTYGD